MLSLQYLIFTILAIYAYLEWRKSYARAICNYKNRNVWPKKVLAKQHWQFNYEYYKTVWVPSLRGATLQEKIKTNLFAMLMICCQ
jgi:hypothetical protein